MKDEFMSLFRFAQRRFLSYVIVLSSFSVLLGCSKNSAQDPSLLPKNTSQNLTLQDLKGRWQVVYVACGGEQRVRVECLAANVIFEINDASYSQTSGGKLVEKGKFSLDSDKNPVQTTQEIEEGDDKGKIQLGIIRMENGILEWCVGPAGKDRPNEFASPPGRKDNYIKLERVTK
jgi:uncharacterized protein (TIGR03067 family)